MYLFQPFLIFRSGFWENGSGVNSSGDRVTLTFFSSSVVYNLIKRRLSQSPSSSAHPGVGIAFFYCQANQSEKQNARYILGSLLKQLIRQAHLATESRQRKVIKNYYDNHRNLRSHSLIDLDVFLSHLLFMVEVFDDVYIIVDGLDECTARDKLLQLLTVQSPSNMHVFASSRPEKDIEVMFKEYPQLKMDEAGLKLDISKHIDYRLAHDPALKMIKSNLKSEIKDKLLEKVGHMLVRNRVLRLTCWLGSY